MTGIAWKRHFVFFAAIFLVASFTTEAYADKCLRGRKRYNVRIDSTPPGATIYIGKESCGILGTTPWEGKLPKGTWKIIVKKDGYENADRTMSVRRTRRWQETRLAMVKKPDPPKIDVRADADKNAFNASIWVDGQLQGQVPLLITVRPGRHLIEVRKDGFENFQQWVEVKDGQRFAVNPTLKAKVVAKKGSILVEADVPGAKVFIDGNPHPDPTPTMIRDVMAGPHIIEVKKAPAVPWKQTVQVEANKTVKVSAQLAATMKDPGGTLRVLSNIEGARVYLDGDELGPAPMDIKDVKPGEHVVEVKAPGYMPKEKRVVVNAGSSEVIKFDLQPVAATDIGVIKVVSPEPEAEAFIDGAAVGNAPVEKELPAGDHFVTVRKEGFAEFGQKVRLEAGQTITVTAELRAIGMLRILSTPPGATVTINGEEAGETPFNKDDIDVGEHVIAVELKGYYAHNDTIIIEGGQRKTVNAQLELVPTGPSVDDLLREQRGLSSFGARALPLGRSTIDFAGGYPYYLNAQITVGAPKIAGKFAFDAGVIARTFLSRTELAAKARLTLADQEPFSLGLFTAIGGGANLIDNSGRNTFFVDIGGLISLTAFGNLTVTGRGVLNIWSDRHCPATPADAETPIDLCTELTFEDPMRSLDDFGISSLTDRDTGVRLMLSVVFELAIKQRWSVWFLIEGAPFQSERAAYVSDFNGLIFLDEDLKTYANAGATYKF